MGMVACPGLVDDDVDEYELLGGRNGPSGATCAYPGVFGSELQALSATTLPRVRAMKSRFLDSSMNFLVSPWWEGEEWMVKLTSTISRGAHQGQQLSSTWEEALGVFACSYRSCTLISRRVRFVPHDFFEENPVREAGVSWATPALLFCHVRIFTGLVEISRGSVLVQNGIITAVSDQAEMQPPNASTIVLSRPGHTLLPGFIDGHVHVWRQTAPLLQSRGFWTDHRLRYALGDAVRAGAVRRAAAEDPDAADFRTASQASPGRPRENRRRGLRADLVLVEGNPMLNIHDTLDFARCVEEMHLVFCLQGELG
ncbi:uncharacterized protein BO97DRAFT_424824 [Aspergillus homomorphus CBS 101889]|uniref:Amidohydrolase-related domain-containing protein n=1 Tax=Aspergillus homomorphus (strain CBS 101889) TaxID=1450537 RepID=A0A395I189_ASPHC|nr:hypothetical protein BO97DRAFT_424824 [Aspergillus homomorphus CBS 101889]RAL12304.1 hypothetical protein BO97DRAFT_424824 [Aspergillus homomorphus CBS 101889]